MNNIKLYLKNIFTGELKVKYICDDCGKLMNEPKNYYIKCKNGIADPFTTIFRCDDCYKKFKEDYNNDKRNVRK